MSERKSAKLYVRKIKRVWEKVRERERKRAREGECKKLYESGEEKKCKCKQKAKKDKHTAIVPAEGLLSQVTSLQ